MLGAFHDLLVLGFWQIGNEEVQKTIRETAFLTNAHTPHQPPNAFKLRAGLAISQKHPSSLVRCLSDLYVHCAVKLRYADRPRSHQ